MPRCKLTSWHCKGPERRCWGAERWLSSTKTLGYVRWPGFHGERMESCGWPARCRPGLRPIRAATRHRRSRRPTSTPKTHLDGHVERQERERSGLSERPCSDYPSCRNEHCDLVGRHLGILTVRPSEAPVSKGKSRSWHLPCDTARGEAAHSRLTANREHRQCDVDA